MASTSFDLFGNMVDDLAQTARKTGVVPKASSHSSTAKGRKAYLSISEAADELGVATHVLRFWESKFSELQPMKRSGGRRYYRVEDIDLLKRIKGLLYDEGYTIRGVQTYLKKSGAKTAIREQREEQQKEAAKPASLLEELKEIRALLTL